MGCWSLIGANLTYLARSKKCSFAAPPKSRCFIDRRYIAVGNRAPKIPPEMAPYALSAELENPSTGSGELVHYTDGI
ncbi:hypothetical protein Pr1d_15970 [Bythopirellula goksoeyrii]|uniref:Uncharacterized protein n=1 Tax=Bythopirellula goksoeyrii TaxID=1400387 RepID=A0A5B9QA45_9BACT|nr:hypothetical protein Pr1d_15970 [Bythopirellula goksoeyrii]